MFAPRVFISMLGALVAFAVVTFLLTGSVWTTAWQTIACAILLQLGYFVAILFVVSKESRERRRLAQGQQAMSTASAEDKEPKPLRVGNNRGQLKS
ncbi:exopolysaccharide production repressor protein [Pararhizobium gei]|uniref:exopolysaccharide production repressor protein n=1 Tax=Pararhizobium gei TaxID=1395951 RepID=UPI0023DAD3ED|nr:exopolysaccharide production repressor protein [Rhizobium gei]